MCVSIQPTRAHSHRVESVNCPTYVCSIVNLINNEPTASLTLLRDVHSLVYKLSLSMQYRGDKRKVTWCTRDDRISWKKRKEKKTITILASSRAVSFCCKLLCWNEVEKGIVESRACTNSGTSRKGLPGSLRAMSLSRLLLERVAFQVSFGLHLRVAVSTCWLRRDHFDPAILKPATLQLFPRTFVNERSRGKNWWTIGGELASGRLSKRTDREITLRSSIY